MRAEINFEKIVESVKKELLIQINLALEETIGDAIKNFELIALFLLIQQFFQS